MPTEPTSLRPLPKELPYASDFRSAIPGAPTQCAVYPEGDIVTYQMQSGEWVPISSFSVEVVEFRKWSFSVRKELK